MQSQGRYQHHRSRPSSSSVHDLTRLLLPRQPWVRLIRPLLPSFVSDYIFPEHRTTWRLHPTSYLDGLRGIAAIIVFFCHYTENNFAALTPSYGIDPKKPSSWLQLPYARIIFSGRPMVHIFFVVSGFALSYKPIKALHARDTEKCYAALASSAFRRPFRLFGPCIVSTFLIMCLRQMEYLKPAKETWTAEFWKWKDTVFHEIAWPWSWDKDLRPKYDIHLWTIPIEFAHSMLLFIVLLMLSRVRLRIRMAMVFALMMYCLASGKWAGFEFLAGLFLAELHVLKTARGKEWERKAGSDGQHDSMSSWLFRTFQLSLVVAGLFLAGWPNQDADMTPGIRYFLAQTPLPFAKMDFLAPQKFWFGLSAVFIVWVVGDIEWLRELFESPLAQYCGRISFAVYICHGPIEDLFKERLLGHPLIPAKGEPGMVTYRPAKPGTGVKGFIGTETTTQLFIGWLVGLWLLGPLVIWAADLFWRAVDNQIVSLARKLEMLCLDETEPSPRSQGYSVAA
jgi:peptidoglycan/LPS O-acetylase OafA/YrhL